MGYAESIDAIRKARIERDTEKDELYALKMRYQSLLKQQKKAARSDVVMDSATVRAIENLRNQISDTQKQMDEINALINKIQQLNERIQELQEQLQGLAQEIQQIRNKIDGIDNELQNGDISDEQRQKLIAEKKALQETLAQINKRIEATRHEIEKLHGELANQPSVDSLESRKKELGLRQRHLQGELESTIKDQTRFADDKGQELERLKGQIKEGIARTKERNRLVTGVIGDFFGRFTPQNLIEQWNDQIPIFLQPVRIETKFSQNANQQNELWVRIFPDDIAVVTHEKYLTQKEINFGTAHWKSIWKAKADNAKKTAAWQVITDEFGVNRAAWVALQCKPLNWANADILVSENDLVFPTFDLTKIDSWTEAPHTRVMPDRFVILCYRGGQLKFSDVGKQVDDVLVVGPAPVEDGEKPSITRDPNGNRIKFGEDYSWLINFNEAVDKGMGFKISLDAETAVAGYDQMVVLGLKLSADEKDSQQFLEELLENHRYSIEGLSLIQQGTPTNNTDEEDAGYSKKQTIDDISKFVEKDQVLFEPTDKLLEATDGQRLADYLGLEYDIFQTTQNGQLRDHTEAIAMNKALYACTLGYYMHSMLNDVASDEGLSHLRSHFNNFVTGRGPLASIRVGNQPYGVLLTSGFSQWKYPERIFGDRLSLRPFYQKLYDFLKFLQDNWQTQVPTLAHISKKGNASDNLMKVLGLHPNSVEFYQRVGYSWDDLKNTEAFGWGGKYFYDTMKMAMEKISVRQLLFSFGYLSTFEGGKVKPVPLLLQLIFQHYHTRLDNKNLIDGEPFSEEKTIKPYDGALNYIDWLIANAGNSTALESQDFGAAKKPNALLYMMLWFSQLHEASQSIYKYLLQNDILAKEIVQSRKFMNMSTAPSVSHWEVFEAPVNKVVAGANSSLPLYEYIHSQLNVVGSTNLVENLAEHMWGLEVIKHLPTARLERLLVEHVDTLSYRLDSWQTSLFEQRLQAQRNLTIDNKNRNKGIYLGAYGYLENVVPGYKRHKVPEDILPESLRENLDNLFVEDGNGGYVHAPSLNHATAAAILRNGYLTHASPTDREVLTVNLSSERVRRAKYLLEGIQNGQTLEALLGYQFERGLHDWTTRSPNPIILNQLKPNFREAFPITKTKVPQEGKTTGPEEVALDYHVTNGLTLANRTDDFPYGITTFPSLDADQINAIRAEKKEIEDTLDAMRDVLTAESAYQLALGNFERASAVMQSISGATISPSAEVINSSRGTDLRFTNKVVIHFDSTLTTNPWPPIAPTQKSLTEPGLNHWIGTLLGTPSKIRCQVMAVDKDDKILKRADNSEIKSMMGLDELELQPIDFLYLIRNKLESSGTSELETRIRYVFAQANSLTDETIVKIVFAESGTADLSVKSFAEILPFTNYLRELVGAASPLNAKEYEPASKILTVVNDNPNNYNWNELLNRAQSIFTFYDNLSPQLAAAVSDAITLKTPASVATLRNKLKAFADAGFVFAFPQSSFGSDQAQIDILAAQGESLLDRFEAAKKTYNESLAKVNNVNTKIDQKVSTLTEMIKGFLGTDFLVMPRFNFNNTIEVAQSYTSQGELLKYVQNDLSVPLPVFEWLHGVSLVRPRIHNLEMARLINDSFNAAAIELAPIQLPYRKNDTWLAVEFKEGTTIDHDTLSIVQYNPQGFNAAQLQCGLLIDSWTEIIPNKKEVTGIGFNYNQPNTVPPQSLMLVVTPEITGHWKWDNLVAAVLDTFARAKRRAIEPDHTDLMNGISTLLPATLTEFSASKNGISLDYAFNIKVVAEKSMELYSKL